MPPFHLEEGKNKMERRRSPGTVFQSKADFATSPGYRTAKTPAKAPASLQIFVTVPASLAIAKGLARSVATF